MSTTDAERLLQQPKKWQSFQNVELRFYRDRLRDARAAALADAEGFQKVLHAIELLGARIYSGTAQPSLGSYKNDLLELAECRCAEDVSMFRHRLENLYDIVKDARNDAMHQGAYARHITRNAIKLAIILEDALMFNSRTVADFMVSEVIRASSWQTLAYVRQTMLSSSFSTLPIHIDGTGWQLLQDQAVAAFLSASETKNGRKKAIQMTIGEAVTATPPLHLAKAVTCEESTLVSDAIAKLDGHSLLIIVGINSSLAGIITAFDLM